MASKLRKPLSWLHTWTGLTLGLLILLLAVTGAGLALRPALDGAVNRGLLRVPDCAAPLSLDSLAAVARAEHPADEFRGIEFTADAGSSVAIQFTDRDYVYVDPCSGRILGVRNQYRGIFGTLDWLHRFRFLDERIRMRVAGWANVGFVVLLILGGMFLWWPKSWAELKCAARFNPRLPGGARMLSLHKVAGIYTSLVLLLIAATAVPISFEPVKALIYSATGYVDPQPPRSTPRIGAERASMESLWRKTQEMVPALVWVTLNYPETAGDAVRVEILEPGAPHANAKSYLYFDAYSGEPLRLHRYASDTGKGRKIYLYDLALHSALVGGLPYQLLLLIVSLAVPVQAWSGLSSYLRRKICNPTVAVLPLRLVKKTVEAVDVCSFEFAAPGGEPLPPFRAGAHIDVHLGNGMTRQYSLCNDPDETHRYLVAVLRDPCSRGGSTTMHDELQVGDTVKIGVPRNHFPLTDGAGRSLLLAGGIGVTPLLCMAERLSRIGADFAMHYCVRSRARAAFVDRIRQSAFADRVSFHVGSTGERLDISALLRSSDRDTHLYVCGPARFTEAVLAAAKELAWPESQLHYEYFAAAMHDTGNDTEFDVTIASSGRTIVIPRDRTVAETLKACGIDIPTACSEGICGTCLTRVLDGNVEHRDMILSAQERARNDRFTPCCSRARTQTLVLDL